MGNELPVPALRWAHQFHLFIAGECPAALARGGDGVWTAYEFPSPPNDEGAGAPAADAGQHQGYVEQDLSAWVHGANPWTAAPPAAAAAPVAPAGQTHRLWWSARDRRLNSSSVHTVRFRAPAVVADAGSSAAGGQAGRGLGGGGAGADASGAGAPGVEAEQEPFSSSGGETSDSDAVEGDAILRDARRLVQWVTGGARAPGAEGARGGVWLRVDGAGAAVQLPPEALAAVVAEAHRHRSAEAEGVVAAASRLVSLRVPGVAAELPIVLAYRGVAGDV
jgi:hypothetical protein